VFEQVMANGTYTYDFIATPAGVLMYHCHVSPVMQHVRMGLYGAFIVHPKNPLPPATTTTTREHNISQTNIIALGIIVLILLIPEIKRAKIGSIELETSHEPLPPQSLAPL
jgi:FtsP/CotA-like multicopper oxidase with cupredoxin domain